jgi:uncharacterized protein YegL
MKKKAEVKLSVIKGDKLFNENTPFVINIFSPESKKMKKNSNADLLCVIDISGSMAGSKIDLVKKSLKVLVELMDQNDRLALILFNEAGKKIFDLNYLTKEIKNNYINQINEIKAFGGTSIMSGLKIAIDILQNDADKNKPNRASSILLLSDGCDNDYNDFELGTKLKELTKGKNLNFTINTFGYGDDHDPKVMQKLASIRDGSFFYVKEYAKVAEFFGVVLGTCVSVVANKASLVVELLNKKCAIKKIFGKEYLFSHEITSHYFNTTMLHFISGKEFSYVLEFEIKIKDVKIGEDLLAVDFIYQDEENNFCKESIIYKYCLTDINYAKANEEYIRSQVCFVVEQSLKLREDYKIKEAKKSLNEMKDWLIKNNKKNNNNKMYLEDINKALDYYKNKSKITNIERADISNRAFEKQKKIVSSERMLYSNRTQSYYSHSSRERMIKPEHKPETEQIEPNKKNCLIF